METLSPGLKILMPGGSVRGWDEDSSSLLLCWTEVPEEMLTIQMSLGPASGPASPAMRPSGLVEKCCTPSFDARAPFRIGPLAEDKIHVAVAYLHNIGKSTAYGLREAQWLSTTGSIFGFQEICHTIAQIYPAQFWDRLELNGMNPKDFGSSILLSVG